MASKEKCMTEKHAQQMESFIIHRMRQRLDALEVHKDPRNSFNVKLCAKDKLVASIEIEVDVPDAECFNPKKDLVIIHDYTDYHGNGHYIAYTEDD